MRALIPLALLAALTVTACEQKPKTPGEKVGAAVDDLLGTKPKTPAEKAGRAIERTGDDIQDAARDAKK